MPITFFPYIQVLIVQKKGKGPKAETKEWTLCPWCYNHPPPELVFFSLCIFYSNTNKKINHTG
jgi:hypothetical protein